jgi:excisionase family DNA binding protein
MPRERRGSLGSGVCFFRPLHDYEGAVKTEQPASSPCLSDLPDWLTPEDVAAILRCSRNHVYTLLKTQAIRSTRFGRIIRIPKAALMEGAEQ